MFNGSGWQDAVADDWGVTAIPSTFLVDPDGNVVARDLPPSMVESYIERSRGGQPQGSAPAKGNKSVPSGKAVKTPDPGETPRLPQIRVSSSETLLTDSPSSGNPGLRDLHVSMTVDADNPEQKYRVSFFVGDQRDAVAWRYEVRLVPMPGNAVKPYYLDIKTAPGKLDLRSIAQGNRSLPGSVDEKSMPLISASYDKRMQKYDLVVPVPLESETISYSLAFFDPVVGQYISNGLVSVL
jgi:hypothetical protein